MLRDLYEAVESLAQMPYKGRPRPSGVRQLLLPDLKYLVSYRVTGETVQVLRIRHMARKPLSN